MSPRVRNAAPIAWPSLSDLARAIGMDLAALTRLDAVKAMKRRKVGREVKVPPIQAQAFLALRGLSSAGAEREVEQIVEHRLSRLPGATDIEPVQIGGRLIPGNPFRDEPLRPTYLTSKRPPAGTTPQPDMERLRALHARFEGRGHIPIEEYIRRDREREDEP
jgi:hypothetical protein